MPIENMNLFGKDDGSGVLDKIKAQLELLKRPTVPEYGVVLFSEADSHAGEGKILSGLAEPIPNEIPEGNVYIKMNVNEFKLCADAWDFSVLSYVSGDEEIKKEYLDLLHKRYSALWEDVELLGGAKDDFAERLRMIDGDLEYLKDVSGKLLGHKILLRKNDTGIGDFVFYSEVRLNRSDIAPGYAPDLMFVSHHGIDYCVVKATLSGRPDIEFVSNGLVFRNGALLCKPDSGVVNGN